MHARVFAAAMSLLVAIAPSALAEEAQRPYRPTVQFGIGSHVRGGGNHQSVSFGVPAGRYVNLLVSAERSHFPFEMVRSEHSFGLTRGGTARFISGELRVTPFSFRNVSPYALAGFGRGTARPTVNEYFPDRITNDTFVMFFGGGVTVPIAGRLSAFTDLRVGLQGERDSVMLFTPLRGGLAWRF